MVTVNFIFDEMREVGFTFALSFGSSRSPVAWAEIFAPKTHKAVEVALIFV